MTPSLTNPTQVFIVRLWVEPREIPGAMPEFRGVVELVPGGERTFFRRLEDLPEILRGYFNHKDEEPG